MKWFIFLNFVFFVTDSEFIYKDEHGGVTLFNADNLTSTTIVTNITIVSKKQLFLFKN